VELSVIVPVRDEEGNVAALAERLASVLTDLDMGWEVIFVDDGSTDDSWSVIASRHRSDPRVKGLRLSRNFGHQSALLAGLHISLGRAVITMDADLQHPPERIPDLVDAWRAGGKIVHTVRVDRGGESWWKRATSRTYYRVFSYLSGVNLQSGMADFRLLDRQVLTEILRFKENALFLRGIVQWVGYPSATVTYESAPRNSGSTKYTLGRMLRFAWHGISSFSIVPLRLGIAAGLTASFLSFLGVVYAIVSKLILGHTIPGWASTVAIVSFFFGILFVYLGLLGEYIGRVVVEARGRPRFLVSEQLGSGAVTAVPEVPEGDESP
jgi:dolichol-phosphate mannosyltransferase